MTNITTVDRFINEPLKIPNAVSENSGESSNSGLESIISEFEKYLLLEALGAAQYVQLQAALLKTPFTTGAAEAAPQEFIDLVEGTTDMTWEGLRPLLDNFIFCAWLRESEVVVTAIGSGKGKAEGFTIADNSAKYASRWNLFISKLDAFRDYLRDSEELDLPDSFPYFETVNSLGI